MPTSLHNHQPSVRFHPALREWLGNNSDPNCSWGWVIDWNIRNEVEEPDYQADGILTDAIWLLRGKNVTVVFVHHDQVHTTPVPFQSDHADMIAAIETARKETP